MQPKLPRFTTDLIGEDVEFFLWDTKEEHVVPAHDYFPMQRNAKALIPPWEHTSKGEKKLRFKAKFNAPKNLSEFYESKQWQYSGDPVKVFRDGLAVEVNVNPTECRAFLWQDVKAALALSEPEDLPKKVHYTTRPVVDIDVKDIMGWPRDLHQLGCNPTMDAYTERQKTVTINPLTLPFRTCGSHLHMSFYAEDAWASRENLPLAQECHAPIIKLADLLIGLPATYIFADELEFKRRSLYGQAGEYRFQRTYGGIEYRALSSRIFNHPGVFSLLTGFWKYVIPCYSMLWPKWDKAWEPELQLAINEGKGMEQFFPIIDEMLEDLEEELQYNLRPFDSENVPSLEVYKKLRELNLAGAFPDAAVINEPIFPDAHMGWQDYAARHWNIEGVKESDDGDYYDED